MTETQYYIAIFKVSHVDDKGKTKYKREKYIVSAVNVTDAEKKIVEYMSTTDGEIVQITAGNIIDIIK
jgi:hypothetical protein